MNRKILFVVIAVLLTACMLPAMAAAQPDERARDIAAKASAAITFDTNGGLPATMPPIETNVGAPVYRPADPTKEGYAFMGWFDADGEAFAFTTMPAENTALKAKWGRKYYFITFDFSGGTDENGKTVGRGYYSYQQSIEVPAVPEDGMPSRKHYTFKSWEPALPATMPANDLMVRAVWEPVQYTITFDTDGGNAIEPITGVYGTVVKAPADPTKTGYVFLGWEPEIPATMHDNPNGMEVAAQWQKGDLKITIPETAAVMVGQSIPMTPSFSESVADATKYTWQAEKGDGTIVTITVNENNNVKGVNVGNDRVRVKYSDAVYTTEVVSNWCAVTVTEKLASSDIVIAPAAATVGVGGTARLYSNKTDGRTAVKDVVWTTSNAKIAKINEADGGYCEIKGVKAGSATITATVPNGSETITLAKCAVTVVPAVKSITIDGPECILKGQKARYTAAVLPDKAGVVRDVEWRADGYLSYVSFSEDGEATALQAGEINIYAKTTDGTGLEGRKKITIIEAEADAIEIASGAYSSDDLDAKSADPYSVALKKTRTFIATATANGVSDGVCQRFVWESSDPKVAAVTNEGVVKGIKAGTAKITVKALDGGSAAATFDVEVVTQVKKIKLSGPEFILFEQGKKVSVKVSISPKGADAKRLRWSAIDPQTGDPSTVASVDKDGTVTMLSPGAVAIFARCEEDDKEGMYETQFVERTEKLTIEADTNTVAVDGNLFARVAREPASAYGVFKWKSSNKKIATVSKYGVIEGVKAGKATITVTATDGSKVKSAGFEVTVVNKAIGVLIDKDNLRQVVGDEVKLKATVLPKKGKIDRSVLWSSSNPDVATVDADGKVTCVGAGKADISVKTNDGGFTSTSLVTVHAKRAAKVRVEADTTTLFVGDKLNLKATVLDKDGNQDILQDVIWSIPNKTQNKRAIVIAFTGEVEALKPGTVIVQATAADGSKVKGTITLTVQAKAASVTLDKEYALLFVNTNEKKLRTASLKATVAPKAAKNVKVKWQAIDRDWPIAKEVYPIVVTPTKDNKKATVSVNADWWAKNAGERNPLAYAAAMVDDDTFGYCPISFLRLPVQIGVGEVSRKEQTIELVKGKSVRLTKGLVFDDGVYPEFITLKWTISKADKRLATISADGILTAKQKPGEITVKAEPTYWGNDAIDKTPVTFTVKIVDALSTKTGGDSLLDIPALPIVTPFEDAIETLPAVDGMEAIIAE